MAPVTASSKQKRLKIVNGRFTYEDEIDNIIVLPRERKQMKDRDVAQTTNKTRRLKEVLIPIPARATTLYSTSASEVSTSSNGISDAENISGRTLGPARSPSKDVPPSPSQKPQRKRSLVQSSILVDDSSADELLAPTQPGIESNKRRKHNTVRMPDDQPAISPGGPLTRSRPIRVAAKRKQNLADFPDETSPSSSEMSTKPRSIRAAVKRKTPLSDEEFDGGSDNAMDDEEEFSVGDTSQSDQMSEELFSEESMEPKRRKTAAKPKVALKAPVESKATAPPSRPSKPDAFQRITRTGNRGLEENLPPLSDIPEIFHDLTANALSQGLQDATKHLAGRSLRVATMCSGTESPLLALELVRSALKSLDAGPLNFTHLFSAEIVPFKQAYIQRNFQPNLIFRDITELIGANSDNNPRATTAYGAMADVPRHVDIIIAGTSCVDYSSKNNFKKGIDGGGESGDTFKAVLDYSNAYRPAVVLLENVMNADWEKMVQRYSKIGYDCAGVLVDTKDYYIPHTRQRGYMICLDSGRSGHQRVALARWQDLMEKFKRPASSSIADFLLPSGTLEQQSLKLEAENTRVFDWSKCEIRHIRYRQEKHLGNSRPFTHWQESGTIYPPENGFIDWFRRQVERVKDTVEIAGLRSAAQGYDAAYKTRIWDLSQNVDRFTDTNAPGISPCITPSGIAFVTDRNAPLQPLEALKLQGLPTDRITFTTETDAEIFDFSGNAMSSTVVGSAILAALISSYRIFDSSTLPEVQHQPSDRRPVLEQTQMRDVSMGHEHEQAIFDVREAVSMSERAARRCYCEGGVGRSMKPIQTCRLCGHTTCVGCGGNPRHEYSLGGLEPGCRLDAQAFEAYLRSALPLRLRFPKDAAHRAQAKHGHDSKYASAVDRALLGYFTLTYIRRTSYWRACYESEHAILQLVFAHGSVEWRLYAKVDKSLSVDDKLRRALKQPVGKCPLTSTSTLLSGEWEWRFLPAKPLKLAVRIAGPMVLSWFSRIGLTADEHRHHKVASKLQIEASDPEGSLEEPIDGTYTLLPDCGTATSNCYKREEGSKALFLFLDPDRTGPPENDCFVFAHDKAMLDYDEVRPVLGRISARWRPDRERGTTELNLDGVWRPSTGICLVVEVGTSSTPVQVRDDGTMASKSCQTAITLVAGSAPLSVDIALRLKSKDDCVLGERDAGIFYAYAWLFESMRRHLSSEWSELEVDDFNSGPYTIDSCARCVPERPAIKWSLAIDGDLKAYEDVEGAANYERAVKARPLSLFAEAELLNDSNLRITVGLNLRSLAHRAAARLHYPDETLKLRWALDTSGVSKPFLPKQFRLLDTSGQIDMDGQIDSNDELDLKLRLFAKQRLAVSWMRSQENGNGRRFELEADEEAHLPHVKWRLEMRATREIEVRGGVCADHPGFGKTITSLALVQAEFLENASLEAIVNTIRPRQITNAPGRLPIAATLVIAPTGLVPQWYSEMRAILPDDGYAGTKILVIKNTTDLAKHTVQNFQSAKIILLSRGIFETDSYVDKLAGFAGMPGPAVSTVRGFAEWLKAATAELPEHLGVLLNEGTKALKQRAQTKYRAHVESNKFAEFVPSRRLRGSKYVAAEERIKQVAKTQAQPTLALNKVDTSPLFELFYFNRIVVDEFHECKPKEWTAITALKADKRWGLSGTPAMGDSYEVAQIGRLLGVPLPVGSDSKGILLSRSIKAIRVDRTNAEQFEAMQHKASNAMHQRIWELDQHFLDTFVRRNIQSFGDMPFNDRLVPVRLDLDHRCTYTELSQHLNSQDMKLKGKSKDAQGTDVGLRINRAVQDAETPEECLSKTAAWMPRDEVSGLEQLIEIRQQEIDSALQMLKRELENYRRAAANKPTADDLDSFGRSVYKDNALRDKETVEALRPLINDPGKETVKTKAAKTADATLRGHVAIIKDIVKKQLLVAKRSLRFLQNMKALTDSAGRLELCQSQHCSHKHQQQSKADLAVSAFCGHAICRSCYEENKLGSRVCPADGCWEHLADHNLLWAKQLGKLKQHISPCGAKLEATLNLLHQIKKAGDKAILFVQFDTQLAQVKSALNKANNGSILATIVESRETAGDLIESFKDPASKIDVIVLDSSSGTAAGFNLQIANHIIFLSPLLCTTQYDYEATMAQAIGRVRRHGQKKEIHVYRVFALDTIDVDILEHRERRSTALVEKGMSQMTPPCGAAAEGAERKERTQLVCGEHGKFSLRPQSWLIRLAGEGAEIARVQGRERVLGWEDFSSLVKFSRTFTEDDE